MGTAAYMSPEQGVVARPDTDRSALSSVSRSTIDRERLWPAKLSHPIQDVAREARLGLSAVATAGSKAVPDDPLVPEERVLDARLPMIARRLLPSSAAECLHPPNGPIPGARPRSPARDTGRPVGRDNDGTRAARGQPHRTRPYRTRRLRSLGRCPARQRRSTRSRSSHRRPSNRSTRGRRSCPLCRRRDAASSTRSGRAHHVSPRPIHLRRKPKGRCCQRRDGSGARLEHDRVRRRAAERVGTTWCGPERRGRPASGQGPTAQSPPSGVTAT